jgi:hypothetical protein
LADSELYAKLSSKIAAKEGLILVDTQALASYIDLLQSLRSDLQLDNGDQSLMLKQLLQSFSGAIFSGEASANESHINGYLMLAQ